MNEYVSDTHALLWHLSRDSRLSSTVDNIFASADAGRMRIFLPTIVVVEVIYLTEKVAVPITAVDLILRLIRTPNGPYTPVSLDVDIADALRSIPRADIPDMPDRIIVATARQLGLPLITRDSAIRRADIVPVIW